MISRAAHANRPEIQARRIALDANPEIKRRKEIVMKLSRYRSSAGRAKFERAREWMIAWREAGYPANYPELENWVDPKTSEAISWLMGMKL